MGLYNFYEFVFIIMYVQYVLTQWKFSDLHDVICFAFTFYVQTRFRTLEDSRIVVFHFHLVDA